MSTIQILSEYMININNNQYYNTYDFETFLTPHTLHNLNNILNIRNIQENNININNRTELINNINNIIINIINNYYIDNSLFLIIYEILRNNNMLSNNHDFNTFTLRDLTYIINNINNMQNNNISTYDLFLIYLILYYTLNYHNNNNYINTIYNTNTNNRNRIVENTINALRNNNNRSYRNNRNNRNILNENIINNDTNNNTTYNSERGGYPGVNSANGIVGPNNTYTQTTNYPIIFDRQIDHHTLLSSCIKCPFCRIECKRTDWFNKNIKDTCDICCEDGDIYISNLCHHKMCAECLRQIRR